MVRHNNQLAHNLPQLQNLIKRDSESYKEEFLQQYSHYKSTLEVFRLTPNEFNKSLDELLMFLAQCLKYMRDRILCRDKIISSLYSLIGEGDQPMPQSLFIYGHLSTGKSLLVESLLKHLAYRHSVINCIEHPSSKSLFEYILNDIKNYGNEKSLDDFKNNLKCDNLMTFIDHLQSIQSDSNVNSPIVIVLDKSERLREMDLNLLPAFLRLKELTKLNILTILISDIVWDKYFIKTGIPEPIKIFFPQYTFEEVAEILYLYRPDDFRSETFYKNYINLFLSVFFRFCRDINELRYMSMLNFNKYVEPITLGQCKENDVTTLWRNISSTLKANLEVIYLRVSTDDFTERTQLSQEIESTTKLALSFELPFYAKFMLIAAYLASYNPPKEDKRLFVKASNKKKKRPTINKKKRIAMFTHTGPRTFPLDRMLAIFCAISEEKIDINANLLAQIPTMCQLALLSLFFELLRCEDKNLREFLQNHIISDIKNLNSKHKNSKVNTVLQNFMFNALKDSNARAAKMSADIMIELYKKNIWNDAKTVNVLVTGCFSKITKVMVTCLKFFLGSDPDGKEENSSDSEDDTPDLKGVIMANKVNKKTKKREKQLKKAKQLFAKSKNKKSKAPQFNFSALHLIHDPQGFAEKLFVRLKKNNDRFEVKLMTVEVISRMIGLHKLFLLNFYPYLANFLQPHQREVTKLLQCLAQASHELVPPDVMEPAVKKVIHFFVNDSNSSDVIAIGLNAVREICSRCPLVMSEDMLQDLAMYKNHRMKSVMMAARSLISLFRVTMPELLHKRDRGKPTEATVALEPLQYGQVDAKDFVPGAEILLNPAKEHSDDSDFSDDDDEDDDSEGEWVDVSHDEDDDVGDDDDDDDDDGESEEDDDDDDDDDSEASEEDDEEKNNEKKSVKNNTEEKSLVTNKDSGPKRRKIEKPKKRTKLDRKRDKQERLARMKKAKKEEFTAEKKEKAAQISLEKILTDEDFKRIDAALIKQQVTAAKRGTKRPLVEEPKGELEGRSDREKFGYKDGRQNPLCSKTNREKKKTKAFQMIKHKMRGKVKRSFKDKQAALRNHLIHQKKMK
ncbi:Similar to SDAD1: Protein SDA1 homolog (Homo sapiens) [Cotesia congregata]|uniref:Origin recognition complex subunit 5 n=1 Tax=Cotesia congregata TaxID=51543 RepID=A0A8J2HE10_COTCN|nr:Similar to SDAD1: Protein SDA1 homolog (Homo sapiens) [Cotesia congregata]